MHAIEYNFPTSKSSLKIPPTTLAAS